jgi:queuine tRNA-ribosyltransferase
MERTIGWAGRCRKAPLGPNRAIFGIVQGGLESDLREHCARALVDLDFDGYAVGGLSVGEPPADMYRITEATTRFLPVDRPRYLMGVGRPQDLLASIARGIDMFDCVMPTRNGRNALAFTDQGPLRLRNQIHRDDPRPLDDNTPYPERQFSRAYLRHLFMAGEMLGPILLSIHNLAYYQNLMARAREAIAADCFREFCRERYAGWGDDPESFLP